MKTFQLMFYHRWRWIHWKKLGFSCFQWWNASFIWHHLYHLWSLQRLSTQKRTHWQVPGILGLENTEDSGDYASLHTRATRLAVVGSGPRGLQVNERLEAENAVLVKESSFLRLPTWLVCWFVVHGPSRRKIWIQKTRCEESRDQQPILRHLDIQVDQNNWSPTSRKQSWLNSAHFNLDVSLLGVQLWVI